MFNYCGIHFHMSHVHWYSLSRPGVGDPEIKGIRRRSFVSLNYLRVNLNIKLKVSGTNVWWVGSMVGGLGMAGSQLR